MENKSLEILQEEIAYRAELQKKVLSGVKPTEEEKLWMKTHKYFSQIHGVPYLMRDVIILEKGIDYQIDVEFKASSHPTSHPYAIYPMFKAPCQIGYIRTDSELTDSRGKKSVGKPVKMLATLIGEDNRKYRFLYSSDCGALIVAFCCHYFDPKMKMNTGGHSGNSEGLYMLMENVDQNCILYRCKAPYAKDFDSLVFTVEWSLISSENGS